MDWLGLADLAIDLTQSAFGEAVVYTPQGGGSALSLLAPFDEAFETVESHEGGEFYAVQPMLELKVASVAPAAPRAGDRFTVRGLLYEVDRVRLNGQGAAECYGIRVDAPVGELLAVIGGGVQQRAQTVETVDAQTVNGVGIRLEAGKGYALTLHAVGYASGSVIGSYTRRANARLVDGVAVLSVVESEFTAETHAGLGAAFAVSGADVSASVTGIAGSTVSWATAIFWQA